MTCYSQIELRDLELVVSVGTYGPNDVVPDAHLLDLTLIIAPDRVLVAEDSMNSVFDYDPLIVQIDAIARTGLYQTQERLMTLIAQACATHPEIEALELCVRKRPVLRGSGTLGVRLALDADGLTQLRTSLARGLT